MVQRRSTDVVDGSSKWKKFQSEEKSERTKLGSVEFECRSCGKDHLLSESDISLER